MGWIDPKILIWIIGIVCVSINIVFVNGYKKQKLINDLLREENKVLQNLNDSYKQTADVIRDELHDLRKELNNQRVIFESKIEEINKELSAFKHQNLLINNELLQAKQTIKKYEQVFLSHQDRCEELNCNTCKDINNIIG